MEDPQAYAAAIAILVERYRNKGITKVVGTEARGFLFGAPVALGLGGICAGAQAGQTRVKLSAKAMNWSTVQTR